nr:MAG TPA: hypothetical protein [Caudoviricetes sp.]
MSKEENQPEITQGLSAMAAFCIYAHRRPTNDFIVRWQTYRPNA